MSEVWSDDPSRAAGKAEIQDDHLAYGQTYIKVPGRWMYLFRAVGSHDDRVDFCLPETRDREAAKAFLQKVLVANSAIILNSVL